MEEFVIDKNDDLAMRLLHYFITEKNYSPIVLHGATGEIWLENTESNSYEIVRIVTNYIHNNEQFNYDLLKTKEITKRIKKKTFSMNMDVLSIFLNLNDNVEVKSINHVDCASIKKINDLDKYNFITNNYPGITKDTKFKEKGLNLFMKLTNDISKKNETEAYKAEQVFTPKKPIITYLLIGINILVFLLMYILGSGSEDSKTVLDFGGLYFPYVKAGEYYRLITASFIHIGIFHLLFNMYALYIVGSQIESFYGRAKYLIIYLFSAIMGTMFSCLFVKDAISAGASGAIFGLFGSLLYFGYHYRLYLGSALKSSIIPLLIFNLFLGFILPGIDISAHIGGLIGGTIISMALGVKYKSTKSEIINGTIITTIFTIFIMYLLFK